MTLPNLAWQFPEISIREVKGTARKAAVFPWEVAGCRTAPGQAPAAGDGVYGGVHRSIVEIPRSRLPSPQAYPAAMTQPPRAVRTGTAPLWTWEPELMDGTVCLMKPWKTMLSANSGVVVGLKAGLSCPFCRESNPPVTNWYIWKLQLRKPNGDWWNRHGSTITMLKQSLLVTKPCLQYRTWFRFTVVIAVQ